MEALQQFATKGYHPIPGKHGPALPYSLVLPFGQPSLYNKKRRHFFITRAQGSFLRLLFDVATDGRKLGHGLGAFRNGMLGEFTGKNKAHGSLNFARRDGLALVGASKSTSLNRDTLKNVIDKGVHDFDGALGDARIVVHLLQDLVNECSIRMIVSLATLRLSRLLFGRNGSLDGRLLGGHLFGLATTTLYFWDRRHDSSFLHQLGYNKDVLQVAAQQQD